MRNIFVDSSSASVFDFRRKRETVHAANQERTNRTLKKMTQVYSLLFQGVMIAGICGMIYLIFEGLVYTNNKLERMVRGIAIATGVLVYGAADAMGVSLTSFITSAISSSQWLGFVSMGIVFPSILGLVCASYIIKCLHRADDMALRIMLFLGTLIVLQYCELYINTNLKEGFEVTRKFAPNLTFLAALGLYLIFNFHPKNPAEP
jgi:hypothetical protein